MEFHEVSVGVRVDITVDRAVNPGLDLAPMCVSPAAFVRTTLPLSLSELAEVDTGRYHSIWLPDHMVSFWPDALWTPEFTDLATSSPSPHRHLDGMAVAAGGGGADHNLAPGTHAV